MILSIGLTEIAIIVCACLAAVMVVVSVAASIVSRVADKKNSAAAQSGSADKTPVAEQPSDEPVAEEPAAKEPVAEEPVTAEPVEEESVAEEPVAEEPAADEPVAEEPVAPEPAAEEPAADEPVAEEPAADIAASAVAAESASLGTAFANVRYRYGFMAKLIQSDEETQRRYGELRDFAKSYKKVRVSVSWRQARISSGRNVLAVVLFKGRRICVAYALDPAEYENSKYGGTDMSEKKRFAKTPYMLKLSSKRKAKYSKELFAAVAEKFGLAQGEIKQTDYILPYKTTEELLAEGLVKQVKSRSAAPAPAAEEEKPAEKAKRPRGKTVAQPAPKKREIEKQEKITAAEAAEIADEAAEKVLEKKGSQINRSGGVRKAIVNVDTLSQNYEAGESVTIDNLVEKGLVPSGTNYVKVLARGLLDKPLHVHADDYSMDAVKMIAATGGIATKHIENEQ